MHIKVCQLLLSGAGEKINRHNRDIDRIKLRAPKVTSRTHFLDAKKMLRVRADVAVFLLGESESKKTT